MLTVESAGIALIGFVHGFCCLPFCILLVGYIVNNGPFPRGRMIILSVATVFLGLVTTYFFFAGMIVVWLPPAHGYSRVDYYKIWFGMHFFGMLVWMVTWSVTKRQEQHEQQKPE